MQNNKNENVNKAWSGELLGKTASPSGKTYIVKDVYLDSNGCTRTGDNGWNSSFADETTYV